MAGRGVEHRVAPRTTQVADPPPRYSSCAELCLRAGAPDKCRNPRSPKPSLSGRRPGPPGLRGCCTTRQVQDPRPAGGNLPPIPTAAGRSGSAAASAAYTATRSSAGIEASGRRRRRSAARPGRRAGDATSGNRRSGRRCRGRRDRAEHHPQETRPAPAAHHLVEDAAHQREQGVRVCRRPTPTNRAHQLFAGVVDTALDHGPHHHARVDGQLSAAMKRSSLVPK